jgi:hypothetical protein
LPEVLELFELQLLLSKLFVREPPLALLGSVNCLRFAGATSISRISSFNVTRSSWHQVVGNCKTEASAKSVPMDSYMAEDLLRW